MLFSKKIILLADDSETFVMYMSILLSRMGFDIIPAESGVQALKLLKIISPDLIMLNVKMPGMDGLEVLGRVKEHDKLSALPVIMVSTHSDDAAIRKSEELGCNGYLTKPIKVEQLHAAIEEGLYRQLGRKRRHLRANINIRTTLIHQDAVEQLFTESISEGGVFVRKQFPLPVGTRVEMKIPLGSRDVLVNGKVIYIKKVFGDTFRVPPGMAIEFTDVPPEDTAALADFVTRLLAQDILESQSETVITLAEDRQACMQPSKASTS